MSADSYTVCPKCFPDYVGDPGCDDVPTELREYYEFFGAETGVLNIDYACECRECGFTWSYTGQKEMDLGG